MAESISRRSLLSIAGVLGGLALVPSAVSSAMASPVSSRQMTNGGGALTWDGVNAEYRDVVARFPYSLPGSYPFPPDVPLPRTAPTSTWEQGSGEAAAYLWWMTAVQAAAVAAVDRGSSTEAARWLKEASQFPASGAYVRLFKDPERTWERAVLMPAVQRGDFAQMRSAARMPGFVG